MFCNILYAFQNVHKKRRKKETKQEQEKKIPAQFFIH